MRHRLYFDVGLWFVINPICLSCYDSIVINSKHETFVSANNLLFGEFSWILLTMQRFDPGWQYFYLSFLDFTTTGEKLSEKYLFIITLSIVSSSWKQIVIWNIPSFAFSCIYHWGVRWNWFSLIKGHYVSGGEGKC